MARLLLGIGVAAALFVPVAGWVEPARAASAPDVIPWVVTVGVQGRLEPVFKGSDTYEVLPSPVFNIRRAGTPERFMAPRDNIAISLYDIGFFRTGAVGKFRRSRDQSDDPALYGLGDVPWAAEIGGFAEYWWVPWLRTRAEVRQGFNGHHGIVTDLTLDAVVPATPQLTLSGGPRLTLASGAANSPYFSISYTQSVASGLPVYDARGGVQSYGAGLQARYRWNAVWTTYTFVEYERLTGSAANSPLVEQRGSSDQFTVGLGTTYSFYFYPFW